MIVVKFKDINSKATVEMDLGGTELVEVEFEVEDHTIENDGIGKYEHHGFIGVDKGENYAVPTKVKVLSVNKSTDEAIVRGVQAIVDILARTNEIQFDIEEYEMEDL